MMPNGLRDHRAAVVPQRNGSTGGGWCLGLVPGMVVRGALVSMGEKQSGQLELEFVGDAGNPFFRPIRHRFRFH
jgi:chorismate synthase